MYIHIFFFFFYKQNFSKHYYNNRRKDFIKCLSRHMVLYMSRIHMYLTIYL